MKKAAQRAALELVGGGGGSRTHVRERSRRRELHAYSVPAALARHSRSPRSERTRNATDQPEDLALRAQT